MKQAKNTICLWYDGDAEEAARFYAETFPDSRVDAVHRAPGDYPAGKEGDVITVEFTDTNDEVQIRELIEAKNKAVRAKDIGGAVSGYATDVLAFDVVNPLQYFGSDAIRKRLEEWFSSLEGSIGLEIRDLEITTGDDVAFSHGLNHVSATTAGGGKLDMWWRETACYRKINGEWLITHQHSSVPFNTETGKASLDLKP
jgi:uncharacterized protein (TIGR02246 family)